MLIIWHREPWVTLVGRHEDGRWVSSDFRRGQSIALISVSGSLAVDDIYRDGHEDV